VTWSLRARLTVSYVLVALLCVLVVSVLANLALEGAFRRFVRESQARQVRQVVQRIAGEWTPSGGWNQAALADIGMAALEQGMIVRVTGADGAAVWDATEHNGGMCTQMISHMAANMASRYPNWRGAYTEKLYPVTSGTAAAGTAAIGWYGPFYLDDQELAFINTLNGLLLLAAAAAMCAAAVVGTLTARRITAPLARVARATRMIAGGRRDVRVEARARVRELDDIAEAVNGLAEALGGQEALRRRLTGDVAHELRTPLAALQSHLEALMDGVWQPDAGRLSVLHEEVMRLTRLVDGLSGLERLEAGAGGLRLAPTDLGALVDGVVRNHEARFHEKGVALRWTRPAGAVVVEADADRVSQAVINLVSNALKYTPAGGSVDVSVGGSGRGAEIRVADSGIGIEAADLPRIFERLYRADASRSRTTGGAGIGLSIAKAIVEAHGGTIRAASAPGRGSQLVISLPAGRE
jgi:two-component system, OmpR family, sensor histidine kinase BaeS